MYKSLAPGLLLLLLSLLVSGFPHWFVLRKYEKEFEPFPGGKSLFLYLFQGAWFFICLILVVALWAIFAKGDRSQVIAVWSISFPAWALLPALFSAITGIYPVMTRKGYYYYERYKGSLEEPLVVTKWLRLKPMGWLQFIFSTVIIMVSLIYVVK